MAPLHGCIAVGDHSEINLIILKLFTMAINPVFRNGEKDGLATFHVRNNKNSNRKFIKHFMTDLFSGICHTNTSNGIDLYEMFRLF